MQTTSRASSGSIKKRLTGRAVAVNVFAVLFVVVGVVGIVGHLRSGGHSVNGVSQKDGVELRQEVVSYNQTVHNPNREFSLIVNNKGVIKGPAHIVVNKGDVVHIAIRPVEGEASMVLDGYEISTEADTTSALPGGFRFVADKVGKFDFKMVAYEENEADEAEIATADGGKSEVLDPAIMLGTVEVK